MSYIMNSYFAQRDSSFQCAIHREDHPDQLSFECFINFHHFHHVINNLNNFPATYLRV